MYRPLRNLTQLAIAGFPDPQMSTFMYATAGTLNRDADALSRRPVSGFTTDSERCPLWLDWIPPDSKDTTVMSNQTVTALLDNHLSPMVPAAELAGVVPQSRAQTVAEITPKGTAALPTVTSEQWKTLQREDPTIGKVYHYVVAGAPPDRYHRAQETRQVSAALREWKKYCIRNGVLHRRVTDSNGRVIYQLYLPPSYCKMEMEALHNEVGHLGQDRSLDLVRSPFYWPGMARDVIQHVQQCDRCIRCKLTTEGRAIAPMVPILSTMPLELLCIDFLTLETSKNGSKDILVMTDHFTKYAFAVPTRNQTAKTAKVLMDTFITVFGFPKRIQSDQGRNFESQLVTQLCHQCGVKKSRSSPYHAQTQGIAEIFYQTLISMLGTLTQCRKFLPVRTPETGNFRIGLVGFQTSLSGGRVTCYHILSPKLK
uniref:Uncharacterized protein LOC102802485 n=1 Tax=Saccoglossus kowalevskii TaxID=10224 RepID=A0ABM0MPN0_SACKO|nr:PREDICTED: uncharacterized protein LOC102802485 [Saccoglossus kowalevskii]